MTIKIRRKKWGWALAVAVSCHVLSGAVHGATDAREPDLAETLKQVETLEGEALETAMKRILAAYISAEVSREDDVTVRRNIVETLVSLKPAPEDPAWGLLGRAARYDDFDIAEIAARAVGAPGYGQMRELEDAKAWGALIETFADEDFAAWPDWNLARNALFLRGQAYYERAGTLTPGTISSVIDLLLNAHSMTGEGDYLDRAAHFGAIGVELFLGDGLALPKATVRHDQYEVKTGGADFMAALLRLHEALGASGPQASDSACPFLEAALAYADTMIESGRDMYGEHHTPLFAGALTRRTLTIGESWGGIVEDFESIPITWNERMLGGANPQLEIGLYALLYRLTELTGDEHYATEADAALGYFFQNCQSPETGFMAWGDHLWWDLRSDAPGFASRFAYRHEINHEWPFWDACYRLAPEASRRFAIGLWDHQVACKETGNFSRHAYWNRHGPKQNFEFPRYAGQMIANWADAYTRPENAEWPRRNEMPEAIATIVGRMEANMEKSETGMLIAGSQERHSEWVWLDSNLELARCLWKAAPHLEADHPALAGRMRTLALQQDEHFLNAPHRITEEDGGFAFWLHSATGEPDDLRPYTTLWFYPMHARLATRGHARYTQLAESHPDRAARYGELILAAADQYLAAEPAAWRYRDAAKADLKSAIEVSRWTYQPALIMLGDIHRHLFNDRESAMKRYLEAIGDRSAYGLRCRVAGMMREDGDHDGALEVLDGIDLDSLTGGWRVRIRAEIARTLVEAGRIGEARELYEKALAFEVYEGIRDRVRAARDRLE